MAEDPFKKLANLLSPRYREEGPPSHVEKLIGDGFLGNDKKLSEPMKTVLDFIVLGYRPVTTLCILATLVENKNKPYSGRQLGVQLEKRLRLEEGKLTKGRYYEDRIGRLLKIMCQLGTLELAKQQDTMKTREGYRINRSIFPMMEKTITSFLNGESLSPLARSLPPIEGKEDYITKQCSKCKSMMTSAAAIYCELCGAPLMIPCWKCGKETLCRWEFCNYCGASLHAHNNELTKPHDVKP